MKNKKLLYGIILIFLIGTCAILFIWANKRRTLPCTQEAKLCPDGSYVGRIGPNCEFAHCPPAKPLIKQIKTTCGTDEDCQLINQKLGFSCCWAGACERIDYSLDKWIAVNRESFEQLRKNGCPPAEKCGPPPLCNPKPINDKLTAKCIDGKCQKAPREETPTTAVKDIVELCETENPLFNPVEECQKIIDEKYPDRECTFELESTEWLPMGSCRNCVIKCM